jgi:rubrerythrin
METTQQIELRNLAQLDVDAIALYDAAIQRISIPLLRDKLSEFKADHERHVVGLNAEIVKATGKPVETKPDLKGSVLRGFTAITSMMGDQAALLAMTTNEELTNRAYEKALKLDWSSSQRALIQQNYDDEKRHLAWIKLAAKEKPWEHESHASVH